MKALLASTTSTSGLLLLFLLLVLSCFDFPQGVRSEDEEAGPPQPPELDSRWDIHEPVLFFCSDNADFIFRFDMSDFIEPYMIRFDMMRTSPGARGTPNDCDIDIWNNAYLTPQIIYDEAPPGEGNRIRQMIVSLTADINLLGVSPVYIISPDGTTGSIEFCIKATLYTKDLAQVINFKTIKYKQDTTISAEVRRLEPVDGTQTMEIIDYEPRSEKQSFDLVDMSSWYGSQSEAQGPLQREKKLADSIKLNSETYTYYVPAQEREGGRSSSSGSRPDRRQLSALDCSLGYDVVFENWWNVTVLEDGSTLAPNVTVVAPVDVYNVTYDNVDKDGSENETETNEDVTMVVSPKNILDLTATDDEFGGGFKTDSSFLIRAFQCDQYNNEIFDDDTVYEQGDVFRICAEALQEALDFDLVLANFNTVVLSRPTLGIYQHAVTNGIEDFYGMAESACTENRHLCWCEITIRAEFFALPGFVNIAGTTRFQFRDVSGERRGLLSSTEEEEEEAKREEQERRRRQLLEILLPKFEEEENENIDAEISDQAEENDNKIEISDQTVGKFAIQFQVRSFQQDFYQKQSKKPNNVQKFLLVVMSFTLALQIAILYYIWDTRRNSAAAGIQVDEDEQPLHNNNKKKKKKRRHQKLTKKDSSKTAKTYQHDYYSDECSN